MDTVHLSASAARGAGMLRQLTLAVPFVNYLEWWSEYTATGAEQSGFVDTQIECIVGLRLTAQLGYHANIAWLWCGVQFGVQWCLIYVSIHFVRF